ncbi:MAG: glutaredoxin family protein [Phycisphaerales bacterium]|nr:glutaredoxin family protein [Phycisphaerales bacterium]
MDFRLTFFTRPSCELCEAAWFVVQKVVGRRSIPVDIVDIASNEGKRWSAQYNEHIPVLHINGKEFCRHRVVEKELRRALKGCE